MAQKACKNCKMVYEGHECPNCGSKESADKFQGKIIVVNPEQSEIAKNIKTGKKGTYAIKLG